MFFRIHNILNLKYKIKITDIISKKTEELSQFHKILANLTIQIAIADLLKRLNLKVESFVEKGFSRLIYEFFENNLSLDETVLSIYQRAVSKNDEDLLNGDNLSDILTPTPKNWKWMNEDKNAIPKNLTNGEKHQSLSDLTQLNHETIILHIGEQQNLEPLKNRIVNFNGFSEENSFTTLLKVLGR